MIAGEEWTLEMSSRDRAVPSRPKGYNYQMWAPIVGDAFAKRLAKVAIVRQLRLPLIVVFLAGTAPYQLTRGAGVAVLAIVAIAMLFVGTIALTVAYRWMLRTVERDFQHDLGTAGMPTRTLPSFRSPDAFEWWCRDNDIDRKRLTNVLGIGGGRAS